MTSQTTILNAENDFWTRHFSHGSFGLLHKILCCCYLLQEHLSVTLTLQVSVATDKHQNLGQTQQLHCTLNSKLSACNTFICHVLQCTLKSIRKKMKKEKLPGGQAASASLHIHMELFSSRTHNRACT